jgi:hypothetical protein
LFAASLAIGLGVGAFFAGRASVHPVPPTAARASLTDAYRAGRDDAFSGFDGGWAYATFYVVTLRRGGPGITYKFARRWPMLPGFEYHVCGGRLCSRRER